MDRGAFRFWGACVTVRLVSAVYLNTARLRRVTKTVRGVNF